MKSMSILVYLHDNKGKYRVVYIHLTTLLTSPIEFSLYFQNYVRYLNENFREVRKIYETDLRSKIMRVNLY